MGSRYEGGGPFKIDRFAHRMEVIFCLHSYIDLAFVSGNSFLIITRTLASFKGIPFHGMMAVCILDKDYRENETQLFSRKTFHGVAVCSNSVWQTAVLTKT